MVSLQKQTASDGIFKSIRFLNINMIVQKKCRSCVLWKALTDGCLESEHQRLETLGNKDPHENEDLLRILSVW